jgi:hypothetical protein
MMTAGLLPSIAAFGATIDAGRMYMVKSQLQAGVDAAALAGARAFGVNDGGATSRTAQVTAYFDGNFPRSPAYMGTTNVVLDPKFEVIGGINVTTVTARATVPMSFMKIFGYREQEMIAVAKAELQPRPLEVMLVLDNTGSMKDNLSAGRTNMTALKEAARSFIEVLHQGSSSRRDLAVGIIPYDITVNVGHLLRNRRANAVAAVDGFTSGQISYSGVWPNNPLAWKGCVMADSTIKDVVPARTTSDANAWDLTRTLPGEGGNPAVEPFFVPPMYVPSRANASVAQKADPSDNYYNIANVEPKNNLYRLDTSSFGPTGADYLSNTALYRGFFYDYYIGLNNGYNARGDDVIRATGGGYFDPNTKGTNWYVDWSRVPNLSKHWSNPTTAEVNKNGGITNDGSKNTTPMPSPNWQCPEEAMLPAYGRDKSVYLSYINDKNGAIYPANGTIHHAGLLWGYRLLVRDDVFTRSNPTNETPRRAIVFMTDGVNEIGESQNGYLDRTFTWYGRWTDLRISAKSSDTEEQMLRRFEKTCANIQRETNSKGEADAPEVYIIALKANTSRINTAFNQCAPGRVYRTSDTAQLIDAFEDVAAELVDLHLVQ